MAAPTAVDSTVLVAALVSWHERHREAAAAVEAALARKALIIPAPALIEAYAMLTRLPAQHRLSHADAYHLLRTSFSSARVTAMRTTATWPMLRRWSVAPIGGGDAFDALIVDTAREAGAKTLLSFRRKELERFAGAGLEVVEPV